jgi:hypothetical protein
MINIDAKVLNKILVNLYKYYIKRTMYHNLVGFIQVIQRWFIICKNKCGISYQKNEIQNHIFDYN